MAKEYVATFQVAQQITEYEWTVINPSMKVTPETTIAEIDHFFRQFNKVGFIELKIIELQ